MNRLTLSRIAGRGSPPTDRFRHIFEGQSCTYCGDPATCTDHLIPRVMGGTNEESNLAPACRWCNASKNGSLTADQYRAVLHIHQEMRPHQERIRELRKRRAEILAEFNARAT